MLAQAGCRDVFIPYNIIGAAKLDRLADLARWATVSVTADSEYTIDGLARRFAAA